MTFEQLKVLASKHFKVSTSQIEGKGRKVDVVYARIAIAKILHSKGYTLHEIGDMLNMTHSNVLHHVKTFDDRMKYDVIFANTYNEFSKECD
jgi:chromosomal replication initiation ATPase DnaA